MKKAEIIKNGNVNLKPIKTGIDWDKIEKDFGESDVYFDVVYNYGNEKDVTDWFKERIEKELNQ